MAKFFDIIKNIFWVLVIIQIAPVILRSIKKQYEPFWTTKSKVGVITIKGVLYSSDKYLKDIKSFFEDPEIRAILLKIESPGGVAGSSQALYHEIKEYKKNICPKLVVALVENIAASGAYYVACAADDIIATPSSFIGSIGVYIAHPALKEFIEQFKIKYDVIKTGKYKASSSPFLDMTPEQREQFQSMTDTVYQQFVKDVESSRAKAKLPADPAQWAEGRIWTGEQALKLGLVDKLGAESAAIEVIKEKANIPGEIEWIKPPKQSSLLQKLLGTDDDAETQSLVEQVTDSLVHSVEKKCTTNMG